MAIGDVIGANVAMCLVALGALALVLVLAWRPQRLARRAGILLVALYPVFVLAVWVR